MKTQQVSYKNVDIRQGFWKNRQDINRQDTTRVVYDRFSDTHRFEALRCQWQEGMENMPHVFWDSDVAKWLEGAAYILQKHPDPALEEKCDQAIADILSSQEDTGYFNSHYLVTEKDQRFQIRNNHELYCAGHLFEAACAYYEATGKDAFLKAMCRYADYIYEIFYVQNSAAFVTCGHPEIELALVRLAETTKNEKYLTLAKYFLEMRGNNQKDDVLYDGVTKLNDQSHLPVKEQTTAEGHSVRACYLYSAMADMARVTGDMEYFQACEKIFDNIINQRMYITGGIGSTDIGESFTIDYDLPNKTSYTETCAAISLAFFAQRMLLCKADAKYADIVERVIYNGSISGVSLDGKKFFYTNPLEIDPHLKDPNPATIPHRYTPLMERVELFDCSCCPPNIVRFVSSIGNYLYSYDDSTVYVHQYADSVAQVNGNTLTQSTRYPADGSIRLTVQGDVKTVALRIPGWCESFTLSQPYTMKNGYAYVTVPQNGEICLSLDMPVQLMESHAQVQENAGKVAVMRGPVVYCLEGVDNGKHLRSLSVRHDGEFTLEDSPEYQVPVLKTVGRRKVTGQKLYQKLQNSYEDQELKFIPYFAFANRGITEMVVWVWVR